MKHSPKVAIILILWLALTGNSHAVETTASNPAIPATKALSNNSTTTNSARSEESVSTEELTRQYRSAVVKGLMGLSKAIENTSRPSMWRDMLLVVAGAIATGAAGFGVPMISHRYMRPVLRLDEGETSVEGKYLSLRIRNAGRSQAINAAGYITIDAKESDLCIDDPRGKNTAKPYIIPGAFRRIDQEGLCWAEIGNPHRRAILPGTFAILDVFAFEPNTEGGIDNILMPTEKGWDRLRAVLKSGKYSGLLTVMSENSQPLRREFEIEIIGNKPRLNLL